MMSPKPWERQDGEPDEVFREFTYYLHMPLPRRVVGVLHGSTIDKWNWSSDWSWISRARQWDDHLGKVAAEEAETVLRTHAAQVTSDHIRILQGLREVLERETGKWLNESREACGASLLKSKDLVNLANTVVKLDRLVRGETTENVGVGDTDIEKLSPEELRILLGLERKMLTKGE